MADIDEIFTYFVDDIIPFLLNEKGSNNEFVLESYNAYLRFVLKGYAKLSRGFFRSERVPLSQVVPANLLPTTFPDYQISFEIRMKNEKIKHQYIRLHSPYAPRHPGFPIKYFAALRGFDHENYPEIYQFMKNAVTLTKINPCKMIP